MIAETDNKLCQLMLLVHVLKGRRMRMQEYANSMAYKSKIPKVQIMLDWMIFKRTNIFRKKRVLERDSLKLQQKLGQCIRQINLKKTFYTSMKK